MDKTDRNMIKFAQLIDNKSIVATVVSNTIMSSVVVNEYSANKQPTYHDITSNQLYNIRYSYDGHDIDEQDTALANFNYDQINDKDVVISALTNVINASEVKDALIKLSKLVIDKDITNSWQLEIITTDFKPYVLLTALLTNNDQPKLINLGSTCLLALYEHHMYENLEHIFGSPKWESLNNVFYAWNTEKPSKIYRKQLIALEPNFDWESHLQIIDNLFKDMLSNTIEDEKSRRRPSPIITLDLSWFIYECKMIPYKTLNCYKVCHSYQEVKDDLDPIMALFAKSL